MKFALAYIIIITTTIVITIITSFLLLSDENAKFSLIPQKYEFYFVSRDGNCFSFHTAPK